jgi:membrane protein implicated in regulation of membrane protease activity
LAVKGRSVDFFSSGWVNEGLALLVMLGPYAWYIAGAVLLLFELHVPGASFAWLAIAAFLTGIYTSAHSFLGYPPPSWQTQCLVFTPLAFVAVLLWLRFGRRIEKPSDRPFLNQRLEGMIGQVFVARDPIVNGAGTIKVGDTTWPVQGPDVAAGRRVVVTGVNGPTLVVQPAPEPLA